VWKLHVRYLVKKPALPISPIVSQMNVMYHRILFLLRCIFTLSVHLILGLASNRITPNAALKSLNPITPELNPSAQHCLTRFFTGEFSS
jgi:hypothetical protein